MTTKPTVTMSAAPPRAKIEKSGYAMPLILRHIDRQHEVRIAAEKRGDDRTQTRIEHAVRVRIVTNIMQEHGVDAARDEYEYAE